MYIHLCTYMEGMKAISDVSPRLSGILPKFSLGNIVI